MNEKEKQIEKEVFFGILPVLQKEKIYQFMDAVMILSGYCIATWSYTQGSYLASLVGFKQLLIGAFFGAVLMLAIYQLPVILSVRYGIDIWIWLRSVFGTTGVKIMTVVIILINFPWYAVCADLFASSMINLLALFGIAMGENAHVWFALSCVGIGTFIAYRGLGSIQWTTRILVPLLLGVGVLVVIVGFTSVPFSEIWNYQPVTTYPKSIIPYVISIEANFAFVITLVGGMAEVPRLTKNENQGFWAGVVGQGIAGSFFVVVGAVMAIAMNYVTGKMVDDPTMMLATLAVPGLALCSLLLVAFANIGTQAVGSYIYGVMLKSTFQKTKYHVLVLLLGIYVGILCVWGKIVTYFGSFLTLSACIYAPLAALLFVDFFFVRKQRISLRSAYELKGYHAYRYTRGFNLIGFLCVAAGVFCSLAIYNPVTAEVKIEGLFYLTPTGCSFLFTGLLYFLLSRIPVIHHYLRKDQGESLDSKPFDTRRVPPKQNLFFAPFLSLFSFLAVRNGHLKITKKNMEGLKPPYLVLATHHSFTDFEVSQLAIFPHRANYVSELEGFEFYGEEFYRQLGCLGTRKFITDLDLIRNIKKVMDRKGILVLYPEARYANVGTSSQIEESVAKLVKMLQVPVVALNMQGNYLRSPIWNLKIRKEVPLRAEISKILDVSQVEQLKSEEILEKIQQALSYNEYQYQKKNQIKITMETRAQGLDSPLYQCPVCGTLYQMKGKNSTLSCHACHTIWKMTELGDLVTTTPRESFSTDIQEKLFDAAEEYKNMAGQTACTIPDWYEWERSQVINEILADSYHLDIPVRIEALPNAVNFIPMGDGRLVQTRDGFELTFLDEKVMEAGNSRIYFSGHTMSSIHTEYNYRDMGQCVTLSTTKNTYFLFPLIPNVNVTKIQFAVEYFYHHQG